MTNDFIAQIIADHDARGVRLSVSLKTEVKAGRRYRVKRLSASGAANWEQLRRFRAPLIARLEKLGRVETSHDREKDAEETFQNVKRAMREYQGQAARNGRKTK